MSSPSITRAQFLALLQEEKRIGKITHDEALDLITILNATKREADGRLVGISSQLACARFADRGNPPPKKESMGTPPQRHSWSLADRRREPIRVGSPQWAAARRRAVRGYGVVGEEEGEEEKRPQYSWGFADHGRNSEQRRAARQRCASRQSSPLCSSWYPVAREQDAVPGPVAPLFPDEVEIEAARLENGISKNTKELDEIFGSKGSAHEMQGKGRPMDQARHLGQPRRVQFTVAIEGHPLCGGSRGGRIMGRICMAQWLLQERGESYDGDGPHRREETVPDLSVSESDFDDDDDDDKNTGVITPSNLPEYDDHGVFPCAITPLGFLESRLFNRRIPDSVGDLGAAILGRAHEQEECVSVSVMMQPLKEDDVIENRIKFANWIARTHRNANNQF